MRNRSAFTLMAIALSFTVLWPCGNPREARAGDAMPFRVFASGIPGCDGIAIDHSGNMYVGSRATNVLYRVGPDGKAVKLADMPCKELLCLTMGKDGCVYAAGRDSMLRVTPDGRVAVLLTGFRCADDLRMDPDGVIYLVDASDNVVYRITPDLKRSVFIASDVAPELLGKWEITGIAFDPAYRFLYIARMNRGRVERYAINTDGTAGPSELIAADLPGCDHLEMDTEGRLYVTLFNSGSLVRIGTDRSREFLVRGGFPWPTGIAFGRAGFDEQTVYIAGYRTGEVYAVPVGARGLPEQGGLLH